MDKFDSGSWSLDSGSNATHLQWLGLPLPADAEDLTHIQQPTWRRSAHQFSLANTPIAYHQNAALRHDSCCLMPNRWINTTVRQSKGPGVVSDSKRSYSLFGIPALFITRSHVPLLFWTLFSLPCTLKSASTRTPPRCNTRVSSQSCIHYLIAWDRVQPPFSDCRIDCERLAPFRALLNACWGCSSNPLYWGLPFLQPTSIIGVLAQRFYSSIARSLKPLATVRMQLQRLHKLSIDRCNPRSAGYCQ